MPFDYRLRGRDERLEVVVSMKAPLSQNEIQILGRHVATVGCQLSEVVGLLNSRLGEQAELTLLSRRADLEVNRLALRIQALVKTEELGVSRKVAVAQRAAEHV